VKSSEKSSFAGGCAIAAKAASAKVRRLARGIFAIIIAAGSPMKIAVRVCALVALVACLAGFAFQQTTVPRTGGGRRGANDEEDVILPSGKSQHDEILKAEHVQNLKDASDLADLAQQLKLDLEKNDRFVLSMATIKKTDDIEKLAKRIRSRLRH
jgi:hypothetical protein